MEEKNQNLEENLEEEIKPETEEKPKSKFNPKILIFGLPIFVIQLIAVYFITANILLTKMESRAAEKSENGSKTEVTEEKNESDDTSHLNFGEYIFEIPDIIVNPANTKGEQLLLSSVAFDVPEESIMKELEKKQILVKDAVISVLSSKSIHQLGNIEFKDSLRVEISDKVHTLFADMKINKVYFSKYILN